MCAASQKGNCGKSRAPRPGTDIPIQLLLLWIYSVILGHLSAVPIELFPPSKIPEVVLVRDLIQQFFGIAWKGAAGYHFSDHTIYEKRQTSRSLVHP